VSQGPPQAVRPSPRLSPADGPLWFGANFWSRVGGPLMWRQYDAAVVRDELSVLVEHGVDLTRSFFYWPDFHPEPGVLDEQCLTSFESFLDLHRDLGMRTVPTFIVGHMSGENWDPAWREGRDLYRNVWMVDRQAWYIRETTARFAQHPAVAAWLISNEMPIYGGGGGAHAEESEGVGHEDVTAWADLMVQAVRAGGGHQPVSFGDGAWGIETSGNDNGFRLHDLAPLEDFVGPHTYPSSDDQVRQHLFAAFVAELCAVGKPVVMEEFGVTSDFTSEEAAGDYYRQVLYSTALAGATGWIAWNNTDFDLIDQDPYRHHPFELHFGITTTTGEPKQPLREMQQFRAFAEDIDLARCSRPATDTSIVVSSFLEIEYPFVEFPDRRVLRDVLLQSYASARMADLAPAMVRETDRVADSRLVIVPSTKALLATTWPALERAAEAGSTVLVTYSVGESPVQRGPWHPDFDRFFSVRREHRYGLADPVTGDELVWTVSSAFGGLDAGEQLRFRAAGTADGRVFIPVVPDGADVLMTDASGRPALLERKVGKGRILLGAAPVEYFAARTPRVNPDDTVRLYQAVAAHAGVQNLVAVDDVRVLSDILVHEDGRHWAVLLNQSGDALTVDARAADGSLLGEDGQKTLAVDLAPYGVAVVVVAGNG
jgi:endo-1,4-beta-mannosidase